MKKKLQKLFAVLLTLSMTMSLLCSTAFADEVPEVEAPDNVVPAQYMYEYKGNKLFSEFKYQWQWRNGNTTRLPSSWRPDYDPYYLRPALFLLEAVEESAATKDVYAYCCDFMMHAVLDSNYRRINLEESTYFVGEGTASHIRGIFNHGYWYDWDESNLEAAAEAANKWLIGYESGEITWEDPSILPRDAEENVVEWKEITVTGENGEPVLDGEENPVVKYEAIAPIQNLTADEALAATQFAIWGFANTEGSGYWLLFRDATDDEGKIRSIADAKDKKFNQNVKAFRKYLLHQAAEPNTPESILFSDSYFVDRSVVLNGGTNTDETGTTTYDFTLGVKLVGNVDERDDLTITATLGDVTFSENLKKIPVTAIGTDAYYVIELKGATAEDVAKGIDLSLSGEQYVNGVYFYEPYTENAGADAVREESQNMVGPYTGFTPVSAELSVNIKTTVGNKSVVLTKTDDATGNLLSGAVFDLYGTKDGVTIKVKTGLETNQDGQIVVDGLDEDVNYYFVETKAPDGYICDDEHHEIKWPNGTVTVENCYDVGELTLSKTVVGVPSDEHFDFSITLDYSSADLVNAETLIAPNFEATWTGTGSGCVVSGEPVEGESVVETPIHASTVAFTADASNLEILTATVQLKHGESLTLKGIPTGTTYTITEEEPGDYTPSKETVTGEIDGTVSEGITNTYYESTSVALEATKTVDDAAPGDAQFTFLLEKWNGKTGEESDWIYVDEAKNDADGKVVFESMTISAPQDDQYYRISEVSGDGHFIYDAAARYAKVVTDEDAGVLGTDVTYYSEWGTNGPKNGSELNAGIVINNKAYKSDSLYLRGEKYLDGELSEKAFSFALYDVTDPENRDHIENVQNDANGVFQFNAVEFTAPGTYSYEVKENPVPDYNCDKTVYTVNVVVTLDEATGELTVGTPTITYPNPEPAPEVIEGQVSDYEAALPAEKLSFNNTTKSNGGSAAEWELNGSKTLNGTPAGGYVFQIADQDGVVIGTVTSKANGVISFPKQTYDRAGTYIYKISEVAGNDARIIYDDTVYTVKITVENVDGKYEVTEELISVNSYTVVDAVTFENKTAENNDPPSDPPSNPPVFDVPDEDPPLSNIPDEDPPLASLPDEDVPLAMLPDEEVPLAILPATGDASALWMVLSALSGAGLFVTRKKREEE